MAEPGLRVKGVAEQSQGEGFRVCDAESGFRVKLLAEQTKRGEDLWFGRMNHGLQ